MDELFSKMQKLIADKLEIEESKVTMDASFRQDPAQTASILMNWYMPLKKNWV